MNDPERNDVDTPDPAAPVTGAPVAGDAAPDSAADADLGGIHAGTGPTPDQMLRSKLRALHDLVSGARSMPMSASCVVNRSEVLALVDAAEAAIPEPIEQPSAAEADHVIGEARQRAAALVSETSVVERAREEAERIVGEARTEAEALRAETDTFIDQRMASFESVLHKTMSQVQLARARLSERSGLDDTQE